MPSLPSPLRNGIISASVVLFLLASLAAFLLVKRRSTKRKAAAVAAAADQASFKLPTQRISTQAPRLPAFVATGATTTSTTSRPDTIMGFVDRYNSVYIGANGGTSLAKIVASGPPTEGSMQPRTDENDNEQMDPNATLTRNNDVEVTIADERGGVDEDDYPVMSAGYDPSESSPSLPRFSPSGLTPTIARSSTGSFLPMPEPIITAPTSSPSLPTDPFAEESEYEAYRILHGWTPQRTDELLLSTDDSVTVFQVFEDGWVEGRSEMSGLVGMFPLACLADPRRTRLSDVRASRQTIFTDLPDGDELDWSRLSKRESSLPQARVQRDEA
ncbi:hypothetical protein HKX48_003897 [Thoreauomyces humboldtii]|nr:hypothetical protein HKX48_003897 [Thoreauomyces humboldtii]